MKDVKRLQDKAKKKGAEAYINKRPRSSNPYPRNSSLKQREAWNEGYNRMAMIEERMNQAANNTEKEDK